MIVTVYFFFLWAPRFSQHAFRSKHRKGVYRRVRHRYREKKKPCTARLRLVSFVDYTTDETDELAGLATTSAMLHPLKATRTQKEKKGKKRPFHHFRLAASNIYRIFINARNVSIYTQTWFQIQRRLPVCRTSYFLSKVFSISTCCKPTSYTRPTSGQIWLLLTEIPCLFGIFIKILLLPVEQRVHSWSEMLTQVSHYRCINVLPLCWI